MFSSFCMLIDFTHIQMRVAGGGGPAVWPGEARALFRNAHDNHLCAVTFEPPTRQYRLRDYTCVRSIKITNYGRATTDLFLTAAFIHPLPHSKDARAPVVGHGAPLAASRQEAVWIGDDQHLYRLDLDTLALIDHSASTGIRAQAPLRLMDRCKVFYAAAGDGRLVEESLQGGSQTKWKVTDHTRDHGAPRVVVGGDVAPALLEVAFQSARVLYRGAEDGRLCELWYCGEAWRVARRDDEDGVVGWGGSGSSIGATSSAASVAGLMGRDSGMEGGATVT